MHPLPQRAASGAVTLRDPRPGDMGWVVQVHGEVYAREYGYSSEFEALVAQVTAKFILKFDPAGDKGWIAEVDGARAGCAFVARKSRTVAQLRLVVVQPQARGLGLGGRLVNECIAFARAAGYRKMTLWTHAHLQAARAIYQGRGFACVHSEPLQAYGQSLVSETWERAL